MRKPGFGTLIGMVASVCIATALTASAQTYSTLVSFNGTDGEGPWNAPLVQGVDGNFYGTTLLGGTGGDPSASCPTSCGTVFKVTPNGQLTTLYSFCSLPGCSDGARPGVGLTLGTNGNFYGATQNGGDSFGDGTVFEISPSGTLNTLYRFCSQPNCTDGSSPQGSIVQSVNNNLYGTTYAGGNNGFGTVFEITPAGQLTTLYSFCPQTGCPDGQNPMGALALGTNGTVVGTTTYGGSGDLGTLFEMTPAGRLAILYSFAPANTFGGGNIANGVALGADGNFYGALFIGGTHDDGAIYKITPSGRYTTLHNFCSQPSCADGDEPESVLVQSTDGNFYGTTTLGGSAQVGNIFQLTPSGALTSLYSFCSAALCSDGDTPYAGLVQGTDGTFYGVTDAGGDRSACPGGCGVVYSLSVGLGPFVKATPDLGRVGTKVLILGNHLAGTTSVTFNGTSAKFAVASGTLIYALVPSGATTGPIQVTTAGGILHSNVAFHVIP